MAKLIKLIDNAYMKGEVDMPQSVDNEKIDHKIYRAQETLRMLWGDEMHQSYLTAYNSGPLTGAYLAVYAYVKQYLAWQAYEHFTVTGNFDITRGGFRVYTEDNSVIASDAQMAMIIKDAKQQAQYYKNLLVGYLDGHSADFPLYNVSCGTKNLSGNTFHISAVSNKHSHGHHCKCGCNSVRGW